MPTDEEDFHRQPVAFAGDADPMPASDPEPASDELADRMRLLREQQAEDEQEVRDHERSRKRGEPVHPDAIEKSIFMDPMEAFLSDAAVALPVTTFTIERLAGVSPDGSRHPGLRTKLELKAIPTARYEKLVNQFTVWERNPATGQPEQITRERELKAQLIIECCTNLDFNEQRLWARFEATDPHNLVERMFLHGEIENLSITCARICGHERTFLEAAAGKD